MSRVLWLGDAGCTTGFGRVAHAIGDRLVADYGHEIHALAVNFDGDAGKFQTGLRLYRPNSLIQADTYGRSRFIEMLGMVEPDVVVMVNDPYVILRLLFKNDKDDQFLLARRQPIIAYMPVDGTNQPPTWASLPNLVDGLPGLQGNVGGPMFVPVVMSKFGHTLFPEAPLVHHGVDEAFRPVNPADPIVLPGGKKITSKRDAKKLLELPDDSILILRVDRNSHRKNFGDTYKAVVPVMRRNPKVHVWFHCRADGDQLELSQLVSRDPEIAKRFHWPGQFSTKIGWPEAALVAVYNAADIFVSTSWGEGFGLTLGEAAACGLPIVAQNVSSIPEVVGPGGVLLEPERLTVTESGQDQWLPNVDAFTEAIERLVNSRGARRELGEAGRQHVTSTFSWDDSARRFHELITQTLSIAETRSNGGESGTPAPRASRPDRKRHRER